MAEPQSVLEYKCPCCAAPLTFDEETQKMTCEYCDNSFDIETVKEYNASLQQAESPEMSWSSVNGAQWSAEEQVGLHGYTCSSCGGELVTDENTAATFCPYCGNPTIIPSRLSDSVRPDAVLPFRTNKEDAVSAFLKLCKGKPLLPKQFMAEHTVEKITGMYVPFWLYDCKSSFSGSYKATKVRTWSDSNYIYTKTDHFHLTRASAAEFEDIPMDASTKMEDAIMESIEPFDYKQMVDFDTAYLSGFLADKYDVPAKNGEGRIRQRVEATMDDMLQQTFVGYSSVVPTSKNLKISHGEASYVLLPVWVLNMRYKDKSYMFAMNGQTGKMTGTFPICPKRSFAWFSGVCAAVTALAVIVQLLVF